jgi:hypothetical protein
MTTEAPSISPQLSTEKPSSPPEAPTGLTKPEPKAFWALAAPISGVPSNERAINWFTELAAGWEKLPDEIKDAMILMQRAFPASGGGAYFLTPPQAVMIIRYCKQKGLEVHGDHWWFDPRNWRVGSTASGLRAEARHKGIDLGPPQLERLTRPWPEGITKIHGWDKEDSGYKCTDFGYRCTMSVGDKKLPSTSEAWFSTSAQTTMGKDLTRTLRAGPWTDNPDNMVQVRSQTGCIKNALGSGISNMPEDGE